MRRFKGKRATNPPALENEVYGDWGDLLDSHHSEGDEPSQLEAEGDPMEESSRYGQKFNTKSRKLKSTKYDFQRNWNKQNQRFAVNSVQSMNSTTSRLAAFPPVTDSFMFDAEETADLEAKYKNTKAAKMNVRLGLPEPNKAYRDVSSDQEVRNPSGRLDSQWSNQDLQRFRPKSGCEKFWYSITSLFASTAKKTTIYSSH